MRAPCRGTIVRTSAADGEVELALDEPASAITPGQSLRVLRRRRGARRRRDRARAAGAAGAGGVGASRRVGSWRGEGIARVTSARGAREDDAGTQGIRDSTAPYPDRVPPALCYGVAAHPGDRPRLRCCFAGRSALSRAARTVGRHRLMRGFTAFSRGLPSLARVYEHRRPLPLTPPCDARILECPQSAPIGVATSLTDPEVRVRGATQESPRRLPMTARRRFSLGSSRRLHALCTCTLYAVHLDCVAIATRFLSHFRSFWR